MRNDVFVLFLENADFDLNICFLVSSIRMVSGSYTDASIYVMVPFNISEQHKEMKTFPGSHYVEFKRYEIPPGVRRIPLDDLVFASATAENLAKGKFDLFIWMDTNTLVLDDLDTLMLEKDKELSYKPVHHTLVGSKFTKPIDLFNKNQLQELPFDTIIHFICIKNRKKKSNQGILQN